MILRYEFIDSEKANYPTIRMCLWSNVSTSGFYAWRTRTLSAGASRRADLALMVTAVFEASHGTYGYRRIHEDLTQGGVVVGDELVRSTMRDQGLVACQPRPYRATTVSDPTAPGPADLVCRDFTADAPGTKLVGDITYIKTWQGWLYLATVIDCYSRMVIGYAMADHMRTSLVTDALDMAHRNTTLAKKCVFHSDRGSQYTSGDLRTYLKRHDMRGSMGRTGICWDNAMAESFFATLKNELVYRTVYPTQQKAVDSITRWIELWYNRKRLHSSLGYRTPWQTHNGYRVGNVAA